MASSIVRGLNLGSFSKKFSTSLFDLQSSEEIEIKTKKKEIFAQLKRSRLKYVLRDYTDYKYWVYLENPHGNYWDGRAGAANQVIYGSYGDDTLFGGSKNDDLLGQAGNDRLYGLSGHDYLNSGDGSDYLSGGKGNDELHGGRGDDRLYGGKGRDTLDCGLGHDFASAGAGDDRIYGDAGHDTLLGGSGNDLVSGENGRDYLDGGLGWDTLEGGRGRDTFVFSTQLSDSNIDLIVDFDQKDEILLKKSIVDKLNFGELSERHFVANTSGKAFDKDDYLIYNVKTGALYYDADANKMKYAPVQIAEFSRNSYQPTAAQFFIVE